eukprot:9094465-Heterocapsa_arctica.AAC.1
MFLRLQVGLSSSEFVPTDQRSARNPMMIARTPEDRSKTFKNRQKPSKRSREDIANASEGGPGAHPGWCAPRDLHLLLLYLLAYL